MATEAIDKAPSTDELEKLLVNNEALARIELYLNRFNPIRVMKMERMEIRHSAILAWLLDPKESHGLDDKFLKAFLGEALRGQSAIGHPTAIDVARADLSDSVVRREWQNIDVFVHSDRNRWAFIIENKYDSKQSEGQLTKYLEGVHAGLGVSPSEISARGIFLTLQDEEPQDERYSPVNYLAVCAVLAELMKREAHLLTAEVRTFLQHYIEIIEEELGMSSESGEMQELARQLYRENKKVFDFVMKYGATSDFSVAVTNLFGDDLDATKAVTIGTQRFKLTALSSDICGCLPVSWEEPLRELPNLADGCASWWAGLPLIIWIRLDKATEGVGGKLRMVAEVGPVSNHKLRLSLVEQIAGLTDEAPKLRIQFTKTATREGTRYSRFLKENVINIKDTGNAEEITQAIEKLFKRFTPEIEAVGELLREYASQGELAQ
ncbi:PDDEXK-like family protein [Erythrobacter sp. Dej080120_24]|uniref:PDDEXK-like family protein n=1 Tax=Erythrobacter sp. Dej080120_24 TaxID=3024837 RepID=UPI0030C65FCD